MSVSVASSSTAAAMGWTGNPIAALQRSEGFARKAIELDDDDASAHALLGSAYVQARDLTRATDELRRAIDINPSSADSYAALAEALLWQGDAASAVAALELALGVDPALGLDSLWNLATAYFLVGRTESAGRLLQRIIGRDERHTYAYLTLAALYAEAGRDKEAATAAAKAKQLNPHLNAEEFASQFMDPEQRTRVSTALKKAGL